MPSSRSACIGPEVKRSGSHGYETAPVASAVYSCAGCATCGRCRRGSACRYDYLFSSSVLAYNSRRTLLNCNDCVKFTAYEQTIIYLTENAPKLLYF